MTICPFEAEDFPARYSRRVSAFVEEMSEPKPVTTWKIHSSRDWEIQYSVSYDPNHRDSWVCSCPGYTFRKLCKHIKRIRKCHVTQLPAKTR